MSQNEKPIATYRETLLEVQREFALLDDRVVIRATWLLKGRFEHVVRLATLEPEIHELNIRYRLYRYAAWITALSGLVCAIAYHYENGGPLLTVGHIALGLMILGTAVAAMTFRNRRIRFARFNSHSGRPGLDIGSAGNPAPVFNAFVTRVQRQIKTCTRR